MIKKIILILILIVLSTSVYAILNPSAIYCEAMGYKYTIVDTSEGQQGICKMPDREEIDSWDFLKGIEGQDYSYCEKEGYVLKTIKNSEKCSSIFSYKCAVCVKENGEEVEVTKLMNLNFNEAVCGDGVCVGSEEDFETCPQDCAKEEADIPYAKPEGVKEFNWFYIIIPLAILIIIGAILYLIKRKTSESFA